MGRVYIDRSGFILIVKIKVSLYKSFSNTDTYPLVIDNGQWTTDNEQGILVKILKGYYVIEQ